MTEVLAARGVPAPRAGGTVRRVVLLAATIGSWAAALTLLDAGISPSDQHGSAWSTRLPLLTAAVLLLMLPVVALAYPARRLVRRQLAAVLAAAGGHPAPELPPFASWGGPRPMFRRLMVTSYSYAALPLVLLGGSAVAFGLFLGEPGAGVLFAGLALVPLFFTLATRMLPRRLTSGVQAGLRKGQVVPVRVASRIDHKLVLNSAYMSWFDAVLPGGQHVTLRTPRHFPWAADARGAVEAADLVLVMGDGGHQGVLVPPGRPADAVWLLGPVPLARVPRSVQRAFAERISSPAVS